MKKTDVAYLAGIFDGEGCVHIKRNKRKDCPKGIQYELIATVRMSNEYICRLFQMAFGGRIYQCKKREIYHKQLWQWIVASHQASDFLETLSPYLIEKKAEATLAFKFQDMKVPIRAEKGHRGFIRQGDGVAAVEEAEYVLMKSLKHKSEV